MYLISLRIKKIGIEIKTHF